MTIIIRLQSLKTNLITVINTYCYISGTFILPKHFDEEVGRGGLTQDGVGSYNKERDETVYKNYYQWVPFVLFLQSLMFYTPHTMFKLWEGEKVQTLINDLEMFEFIQIKIVMLTLYSTQQYPASCRTHQE